MRDPDPTDDIPPDLPPEYAQAYRRGYERAYRDATGQPGQDEVEPPVSEPELDDEPRPVRGPLFADEYAAYLDDDDAEPTIALGLPVGATKVPAGSTDPESRGFLETSLGFDDAVPLSRGNDSRQHDDEEGDKGGDERRARPGWSAPVVLAGLILVLVAGAFAIGRLLSGSLGDAEVSAPEPEAVELGGDAATGGARGEQQTSKPRKGAYRGAVETVVVGGASGSCQAPASVDSAGNQVGYSAANVYDGDLTTAWRCNGTGVGQSLTLTLPEAARIAEVALVPGYAKTDPRSGVDRYAENNRVTRVRWTFPDGSSVVQPLDGSVGNRAPQALRIRPTEADTVTLEVLASVRGPRNTMAISEISVSRVAQ